MYSVIFDPKFDKNFDFADLICETVENPFVEVMFDQQERLIWVRLYNKNRNNYLSFFLRQINK